MGLSVQISVIMRANNLSVGFFGLISGCVGEISLGKQMCQ